MTLGATEDACVRGCCSRCEQGIFKIVDLLLFRSCLSSPATSSLDLSFARWGLWEVQSLITKGLFQEPKGQLGSEASGHELEDALQVFHVVWNRKFSVSTDKVVCSSDAGCCISEAT